MAFILIAVNVTEGGLVREEGLSDYNVEGRINDRTIVRLKVKGHVRDSGAAQLLRLIADEWDKEAKKKTGYERAVEWARKHNSHALLCALSEEGYEGDGCDYNSMVDGWEKEK
jgi:hypothetical protein